MTTLIIPGRLLIRFAALVYDSLLIAGLWIAATGALMPIAGGAVESGASWYRLYLFGITAAFYLFFWCRSGQTLGMRAWRLQVRRDDGGLLTLTQATLRLIVCWLTLGLCFVWCLFDPAKRGLQDVIARTEVVRLPKGHEALTQ